MGFQYFVLNVNTVFVTDIIPPGIVGMVAGAHRIDVMLLHQLRFFNHAFDRQRLAVLNINFMAVHTLDQRILPIDEEALSVGSEFTKPESATRHFDNVSVFIAKAKENGVEIWIFRRPFARMLHFGLHRTHGC